MKMKHTTIYGVMVTGKTPEHEIYARYSVEQFNKQTYPSKKLIIINDGEFSLQDICNDIIVEVRVDNSDKKLTLGDLRNIGLDQLKEGDTWIQWDDDDYRDPELLEKQYKVFNDGISYFTESHTKNNNNNLHIPSRKITPKACFLHAQLRYIEATNHLFEFSSSKTFRGFTKGIMGTGMFIKVSDIRYPSLSKSEDEEFRDLYDEKYGVVTFINEPSLYVKIAHNESTWEWEYYYNGKCKRSGSDMKHAQNLWSCNKHTQDKISSILTKFNKHIYLPLLASHRKILNSISDVKRRNTDILEQSGDFRIISSARVRGDEMLARQETLKDSPGGRERWFNSIVKFTYNGQDINIQYGGNIYQSVQRGKCSATEPCVENIKIIHTSTTAKNILLTCRMCIKYTLSSEIVYRAGLCRFNPKTLTMEILDIFDTDNHKECIFFAGRKIYKLTSVVPLKFIEVTDIKNQVEPHLDNEEIVTHPFNIKGSLYGFCYRNNKKTRRSQTDYILSLFYNTPHGISPIYCNPKLEHTRLPVYLAGGMNLVDFQLTGENQHTSGNQHYSKYWSLDINK